MPLELPKDRPDDLDRVKGPAADKLQTLCAWCREKLGRDPRGGGISFVARPAVVAQLWNELPGLMRRLYETVVVGTKYADIVFTWEGISIRARANVKDDNLHAIEDVKLPESSQMDRRVASQMRWRAARGQPMLGEPVA